MSKPDTADDFDGGDIFDVDEAPADQDLDRAIRQQIEPGNDPDDPDPFDEQDDEPEDQDGDQEAEEDEAPEPGSTPGTMSLECVLTDEEIAKTAREMAELEREIEQVEEAKKSEASRYSERLKGLRARSRLLARGVREGKIWRDVEVRKEIHNLLEVTVRLDTGKTIHTRPLSAAERQEAFAGMTVDQKAAAMPAAPEPEPARDTAPEQPAAEPEPAPEPLTAEQQEQALWDQIAAHLGHYPEGRTPKDVAEAVGITAAAARGALDDMVEAGRATKVSRGRWTVPQAFASVQLGDRVVEVLAQHPSGISAQSIARDTGAELAELGTVLELLEIGGRAVRRISDGCWQLSSAEKRTQSGEPEKPKRGRKRGAA